MGRFHQHFTSTFYVRRSQWHKKDLQLWLYFFALLESARLKAAHLILVKSTPCRVFKRELYYFFLFNLSFFRYLRRVQSQSCTSPLPLLILRSPFYFWPLAIQPCCTLWKELKGLISQLNKSIRKNSNSVFIILDFINFSRKF